MAAMCMGRYVSLRRGVLCQLVELARFDMGMFLVGVSIHEIIVISRYICTAMVYVHTYHMCVSQCTYVWEDQRKSKPVV